MKKNINLISRLTFVFLGVFLCVCAWGVYVLQKSNLQKSVLSSGLLLADSNLPAINSALAKSDDIRVLQSLETLSQTPNITAAFIADSTGKIILHTDITKLLSQLDNAQQHDLALGKEKFIQDGQNPNSFLYSALLNNGDILFVEISAQQDVADIASYKIIYFAIAALLAFFAAWILNILLKKFILKPYESLGLSFGGEDTLNGNVNLEDRINAQKQESARRIDALKAQKQSLLTILDFETKFLAEKFTLFIALDSFNNVANAYDKNGGFLKDVSVGKNIIEQIKNLELLKVISKSSENPNEEIKINLDGLNINVLTLTSDNQQSTIIWA
ncbi:MAG: hypothetical protein LBC07_00790 [Elusimicrobiota bacterium]|jgi:hypothetical protein|nr:hypothetical protein [Elusimicrobiota bacterium]